MRNSIIRCILIALGMVFLVGCAPKRNIQLSEAFWENRKQTIMVASFKAPEPALHEMGRQGLLDIAITSAVNKKLNHALKRADLNWYKEIASNFVQRLKNHHIHATIHPEQLVTDKNQKSLLAQLAEDKLLTIHLRGLGARRHYYGFIPTGAPEAFCVLTGELIDPKDKKVWWRHDAEIVQPISGDWDQPPNYPNLMHALTTAMDEANQELLDSFFSGH